MKIGFTKPSKKYKEGENVNKMFNTGSGKKISGWPGELRSSHSRFLIRIFYYA